MQSCNSTLAEIHSKFVWRWDRWRENRNAKKLTYDSRVKNIYLRKELKGCDSQPPNSQRQKVPRNVLNSSWRFIQWGHKISSIFAWIISRNLCALSKCFRLIADFRGWCHNQALISGPISSYRFHHTRTEIAVPRLRPTERVWDSWNVGPPFSIKSNWGAKPIRIPKWDIKDFKLEFCLE
jgi:hypothetical protein